MGHRALLLAVGLVVVLAAPAPAFARSRPPKADESAQLTCQMIRFMTVNAEAGFPSDLPGDVAILVGFLDASDSKGSARLAKRLLHSRTEAAQKVGVAAVGRWCSTTLQLRCSAIECGGGRRVKSIAPVRAA